MNTGVMHLTASMFRMYDCLLDEIANSGKDGNEAMSNQQVENYLKLWLPSGELTRCIGYFYCIHQMKTLEPIYIISLNIYNVLILSKPKVWTEGPPQTQDDF